MVRRIIYNWILLILILAILGDVTVAAPNPGRTAADFLLIGGGSRAAGMSGAFTAVSQGASASWWNPAGLTSLEGGQVVLGHYAWLQDVTVEQGAFALNRSDRFSIAASLTYLDYGKIDGYNASGTYTGDIPAYDWSGALSIGVQATDRLSLGLTAKFINQRIDDINSAGVAADFGLLYHFDRLSLGAVVANLGPKMTFENVDENLPLVGRVGVAFNPLNKSLLTSIDLEMRAHGSTVLRQGFEFDFGERYYLRSGYAFFPEDDQRPFSSGLTFGGGLHIGQISVDYAYTTAEKYSSQDIHRFSVDFEFGR